MDTGRSSKMKYIVNKTLCHYTTEDGKYRIEKNFSTDCYRIKDMETFEYLREGYGRLIRGRLRDAKAYVESLYE